MAPTGASAQVRSLIDPVLPRLPKALWRALPALLVLAVVWSASLRLASLAGGALLGLPVSAVLALPLGWAVLRVSEEIFVLDGTPPLLQSWLRALLLVAPVGLLMTATAALGAAGLPWLLAAMLQLVCGLAALVSGLVAVVALPWAVLRGDVGLRSILMVALTAALRRPLAPLAVALALLAGAGSALPFVPAVTAVLAPLLLVAASWNVAAPAGVQRPDLLERVPAVG